MKKIAWPSTQIVALSLFFCPGCNDGEPFARAYRIENRTQGIGGVAALADIGDFVLDNDRIRLAFSGEGNSTGPGVFGGSLMDADLRRSQAPYRSGRGMDQFSELFPIGNLAIPAICLPEEGKPRDFCKPPAQGSYPSVAVLCDGGSPCEINLSRAENADYAMAGALPSAKAAILRVQGQSGNYLEALGLVDLVGVKMSFLFRNDYILEPGASVVRIRTMLTETDDQGAVSHPQGRVVYLPPLTGPLPLFGVLLGSLYPTELPGMQPGICGGDFLFFGERLKIFAKDVGFDIYKDIRNKFALGQDPLNNPISADFLAGVGNHVSYAIASADPGGKYLLPLYSGAVTAGFSHAVRCYPGVCPGSPQQCANVIDCTLVRGYVFERIFAVGDGDVASAAESIYRRWGTTTGRASGHVYDLHTGMPVSHAEVHVFEVPKTMGDCRPEADPVEAARPYRAGAEGFVQSCLERRNFMGAVNHLRTDRRATDLPEGAFGGRLPVGRYYLLAKQLNRPASRVVEVEVREDREVAVSLLLGPPARVQFEVRDEHGRRVPAKLTVGQCFPNCSGRLEAVCEQDLDCESGKCLPAAPLSGVKRCQVDNCPPDRLCDREQMRCVPREPCRDHADCEPVERCLQAPEGGERHCGCVPLFERRAALGEGAYPPGVVGYAYTADGLGELELEPGAYEIWASRGLEYSVDRQQVELLPGQARLVNAQLVREVDTSGWISADFHVHGQNSYDAEVKHRDRVIAFAGEGVELLSTSDHDYLTDLQPYLFELGLQNWVATQVGLEVTTVELGHFLGFPYRYQEWRDGRRVPEQGAIDWTGKPPDMVFDEMQGLGRYGPEDSVTVVAHPRDSFFGYFDQYGLSAYNPEQVEGSLLEWFPQLGHMNPLADPELFSGRFDALELFNSKRFELIRTPTVGEIRAYHQGRLIIQSSVAYGATPDLVERQLIQLDRRFIQDILQRTPGEQDAVWDSDGSEACDLLAFCVRDDDCNLGRGERCDPESFACYRPCLSDADCPGGGCREGRCDPGLSPADLPCKEHEGVVDDWFRLLDYGVVRTGLGNSDTHQLFTQTEAGLPRNFIRLSAETPTGIDQRELARNIKAGRVVASYGPFVEIWLGDREVGQTLSLDGSQNSVALRIRVQSPRWFDVDRVEVYRSGRLIHVFTGEGDELDPAGKVDVSGLKLPNRRVVNLDAELVEPVPQADSWYVVIAMGSKGRDLSPVYSEHPYLKLEVGDIMARSFASVPLPINLSTVLIPRVFRVYPYAVTNPVFLDVDGNGRYDAPHPPPAWVEGGKKLGELASGPLGPETDRDAWRYHQLRSWLALLQRALQYGRAR